MFKLKTCFKYVNNDFNRLDDKNYRFSNVPNTLRIPWYTPSPAGSCSHDKVTLSSIVTSFLWTLTLRFGATAKHKQREKA